MVKCSKAGEPIEENFEVGEGVENVDSENDNSDFMSGMDDAESPKRNLWADDEDTEEEKFNDNFEDDEF